MYRIESSSTFNTRSASVSAKPVRHIPILNATFALEKRKKRKDWNEKLSHTGRKEVIEDMLGNPGGN